MTRGEAMAFAISVGKPIRHKSFSKGEFVRYKGKELVDEDEIILPQQEFWAIRSGGSWENGWRFLRWLYGLDLHYVYAD